MRATSLLIQQVYLPFFLDAFHELGFELPAGHLTFFKLPRKFIRGYLWIMAYHVYHPEGFCDRNMATVKYGISSGGFLRLATGASP